MKTEKGCGSKSALLKIAFLTLALAGFGVSVHAQTYSVIHSFTGGGDGGFPAAGLARDANGNFYGTTEAFGGPNDFGTVFRLKRAGAGWILTTLFRFYDPWNGVAPMTPVTIGPDGTLFGTAPGGGACDPNICGVVYRLQPPSTICGTVSCSWSEMLLHTFTGFGGAAPTGALIFDNAGNLYGTTATGLGTRSSDVFQMVRSNGQWNYTDLYTFTGGSDGLYPQGVIFDTAGNLYGTASDGGIPGCQGYGCGTVFELVRAGDGWVFQVLYSFSGQDDGGWPTGGLVEDASGNFYGTTLLGGNQNGGTVFELSPSNGSWVLTTLYKFEQPYSKPTGYLAMDAAGNLYGTTTYGGTLGHGTVFKLTRNGGGWSYSSLHDFTNGTDGANPLGSAIFGTDGNLYGTASQGGVTTCVDGSGCGVVWEITQ